MKNFVTIKTRETSGCTFARHRRFPALLPGVKVSREANLRDNPTVFDEDLWLRPPAVDSTRGDAFVEPIETVDLAILHAKHAAFR